MQTKLVFYFMSGCSECDEVESILQSIIASYERTRITASSIPGKILVWNKEAPTEYDQSEIPAVPALWDRTSNILLVGSKAILGYFA